MDEAGQLNEALSQSGYTAEGKAQILKAIEAKLGCDTPCESPKGHKWNYLLDGMPNYITARDKAGLLDVKKPLLNKIQIMIDRLNKLGVSKPDEWTYAWAVAIVVLCHFKVFPKYKQVWAILNDFKDAHHATKMVHWPFSVIKRYPLTPSELP